ncbi:MAG: metal ABC transporter ATP-binding protein [Saccharofermentanales bacterium]|jgi:zinc transport system ATP-binding protein
MPTENQKTDNQSAQTIHPWHNLHLENVTVRRGGKCIIADITFSLACGELVVVTGPNGGGKSTLLRTILGEWPYEGAITFSDCQGKVSTRPTIGYMPQHLIFDRQAPLTVADLMLANCSRWPVFLSHRKKDRQEISKILEQVDASRLIDRRLGELSGGELQRVTLAFALNPIPDILLLDEPVSALDAKGQALFYQLVLDLRARYDLLTLVVSHNLDIVTQYATSLIVLNRTIRFSGPTRDVLEARESGAMI